MGSPETQAPAAQAAPARIASDDLATAPGLILSGLTKRFPKEDWLVLDGIDLTLESGTTVSIRGSNGAGKTTLLRVLGGLIEPDSGTVTLNGLDSERDARDYRSRISLLSAGSTGLFARLSVRRHLRYWARLGFLSAEESEEAIERMLDMFDLRGLAHRRADRISMGQRQRVRVAMTFLHDPELVLLDEPQNSLDDEGVETLEMALQRVLARGGVAVWCSPAGMQEERDFDQRFTLEAGRLHPA